MHQDQRLIHGPGIGFLCLVLGGLIISKEDRFGEFQIARAEAVPEEGIQRIGGVVEPVRLERAVDLFAQLGDFTDNPAVQGQGGLGWLGPAFS